MKKSYEKPEIEFDSFVSEDIITESTGINIKLPSQSAEKQTFYY